MSPFERLVIPAPLLDEVVAHARDTLPHECCGLLAGRIADGSGTASVRYAIRNDAASETEYATNARDMLSAFRAMRDGGLELLAIYHSHPTSAPVPSRRDLASNTYGETASHLIVGFAATEPVVRAWWLTETGYREVELRVDTNDRSERS
ncbi:mov34 mpn pad-1 family protein : Putative metal-dependent protease of the PAD1/JAB1 superfamily OS=Singulisphaera acidiphila (strain ATCC BAA-1392 / DSM 18658 / VKM B-2454 / MOB10) GN=Sinac_2590 PE=4 SV=1: Prok-JAB [Gemmataceae bacterium]|nr:mov34 mpn pad-1 family protein : Putative metal-dependent protease of the PAD1/JAB1 superfamily OS=Singulisphaera acidiphila (strain ATCC BAA-1392 / DSM 18658 / VKM B-2454 / MOB10) GN=Sinac_2590 PE=4 SV=1: Prok-JAB [Gemmataceae bacterium]VTU02370.1 mov34 mpn pad-1 family protein : Putative metal-dependent protease of the PAD1/JAB1 superfamily OS=Singulisphaera acidiphila (strain ATCC BAA-1392 / DSM 18658 / VKM B-2454 / MOB10) GN=Sinac_2590 PE=4 SV=1: Prok-JAB [Gemmataceae bacterium]